MEWWDATEDQVLADPALGQARQAAYYNVFYATVFGRQVLADLKRLGAYGCWATAEAMGLSREEFLQRSSIIGHMKANACVDDEMALILAESKVAMSRVGKNPPQTETKKEKGLLEI